MSYKFCWISRDCNGAAHASVKLAGSLLKGPFLVISITSVLVMLIFAGSIVLILFLSFFFYLMKVRIIKKKKKLGYSFMMLGKSPMRYTVDTRSNDTCTTQKERT